MAVSERKGLKQAVVVRVKGVRTASMCLGIGCSSIDSYSTMYLKHEPPDCASLNILRTVISCTLL